MLRGLRVILRRRRGQADRLSGRHNGSQIREDCEPEAVGTAQPMDSRPMGRDTWRGSSPGFTIMTTHRA